MKPANASALWIWPDDCRVPQVPDFGTWDTTNLNLVMLSEVESPPDVVGIRAVALATVPGAPGPDFGTWDTTNLNLVTLSEAESRLTWWASARLPLPLCEGPSVII